MSNTFYPKGISRFLTADIDVTADTIKVVAVDSTYTYSSTDEFYTDLTGVLGTATALSGKSVADDGIFDASTTSYPGVGIGETVVAWILYKDTGVAGTSPLIAFTDTNDDGTSVSRAGDGSNIPIVWSNSTSKVFQL